MRSQYSLNDRIKKQIYKKIDIFNYNYFLANKKESEIFQKSVDFSKKHHTIWWDTYERSLEYKFYNYQIFIELLTRYHKKMWIDEKSFNYLLLAYEDLKLCHRFLYLWYYTTAWFHLRWFFEKNTHWIYLHYYNKKIFTWESKTKLSIKGKADACLQRWELSYENEELKNENKEDNCYNQYYFPTWEIVKLYWHYSANYVHDGKPNADLEFSENEFKKLYFLIHMTLIYIPRFFKVTIWNEIEKYRTNKILNPADWETYYRNDLQYLFWENKWITNQYSEIYNLIHDNKFNWEILKSLKIKENDLFWKEYLKQIEISNSCRKKAKWDSEKYNNLIREYYKSIDNKKEN